MREFIDAVARGAHDREGWPSSAYSVSKVGMNALARSLARELSPRAILVNAVNPGWVRTDMGGRGAPLSVEEGADTIVWAATLPPDGPNGEFLHHRKPQAW
jgi:NAD(P)-dependent dehydrogenase (short-subunit alcohol dehydrogenase family)